MLTIRSSKQVGKTTVQTWKFAQESEYQPSRLHFGSENWDLRAITSENLPFNRVFKVKHRLKRRCENVEIGNTGSAEIRIIRKKGKSEIDKSLVNDLWEELRIEWLDMELQHLCFEFLKELRPGVIFQWNYSPRATDTSGITVLPCLSFSSGTPK